MNEQVKFEAIVINIFDKNDHDARVKILTKTGLKFLEVKSFFKLSNKNRSRLLIGGLVECEVLPKYSRGEHFFLKRARLLNFIDTTDALTQQFNRKLLGLLQKIEQGDLALFTNYKRFVTQVNKPQLAWFMTFLLNQILRANNKILNLNWCTYCRTNQNLFAFNWHEGGMFCFEHHVKNHPGNETRLNYLKSLYFLGLDPGQYYQNADASTNEHIFQMLLDFDQTY